MVPPVAISLGWTCHSAVEGVARGLRARREDGYKTCPFDAMVSNYDGVCRCIRDDFADLTNPEFLEVRALHPALGLPETHGIFNTKYAFYFNHESPGHGDLHETQAWFGGPDHFIANNFLEFRRRYDARVASFRAYVEAPGANITFVVSVWNRVPLELRDAIRGRYPALTFRVACFHARLDNDYGAHALNLGLNPDSVEVTLAGSKERASLYPAADIVVLDADADDAGADAASLSRWRALVARMGRVPVVSTRKEVSFHEHVHVLERVLDCASRGGRADYLEVGAWKGATAIFASQHPRVDVYVTTVDPLSFDGQAADLVAMLRAERAGARVAVVAATSDSARSRFERCLYDVVFIDGDHSEGQATRDLDNYAPLVRPGGFLVVDDYLDRVYSPGVRRAVDRWVSARAGAGAGGEWEVIGSLANASGARTGGDPGGEPWSQSNEFILRRGTGRSSRDVRSTATNMSPR